MSSTCSFSRLRLALLLLAFFQPLSAQQPLAEDKPKITLKVVSDYLALHISGGSVGSVRF